ncbi:MAG: hypothetical protein ACRCW6_02500 [Mycoplasmoidaceae bacterium]
MQKELDLSFLKAKEKKNISKDNLKKSKLDLALEEALNDHSDDYIISDNINNNAKTEGYDFTYSFKDSFLKDDDNLEEENYNTKYDLLNYDFNENKIDKTYHNHIQQQKLRDKLIDDDIKELERLYLEFKKSSMK